MPRYDPVSDDGEGDLGFHGGGGGGGGGGGVKRNRGRQLPRKSMTSEQDDFVGGHGPSRRKKKDRPSSRRRSRVGPKKGSRHRSGDGKSGSRRQSQGGGQSSRERDSPNYHQQLQHGEVAALNDEDDAYAFGGRDDEEDSLGFGGFDDINDPDGDDDAPDLDEGPSASAYRGPRGGYGRMGGPYSGGHGLPPAPKPGDSRDPYRSSLNEFPGFTEEDLEKIYEEDKRKRWLVMFAILLVVLGTVAGITVVCLQKFGSKPDDDQSGIEDSAVQDDGGKLVPFPPVMKPATTVVPPAPFDIKDLCSLANVASVGAEAALLECERACEAAQCCYGDLDDGTSCLNLDDTNERMCRTYSPFCDVLHRPMGPGASGVTPVKAIPKAPSTLHDTCDLTTVQSSDQNRKACSDLCSVGWCCFNAQFAEVGFVAPDDQLFVKQSGWRAPELQPTLQSLPEEIREKYLAAASCFEGNANLCASYAPCLSLTLPKATPPPSPATLPNDEGGPPKKPPIPEPPTNLPIICGPESRQTPQGQVKCQAACLPGSCCGSADPQTSCFLENESTCALYGPCQALLDAAGGDKVGSSPPPPPPDYLPQVCSYEILGRQEYFELCRKICAAAECCLDGTCPSQEDGDADVCLQYEPCRNLRPLPNPPVNLSLLCSEQDDLRGCEEACEAAMCCFSSNTDSCFDSQSESCAKYGACGALMTPDDGDKPGVVPMPPSNAQIDQACAASRVDSETGRQQCEEACEPAICCFNTDIDVGINCFSENEEACGEYGPCLILYEDGEDEIMMPPATS